MERIIGFVGLGVMGKSMARHLLKKYKKIYVYTRTKNKALDLLDEGAIWCDSVSDIASKSDIIFTIVGFPEDVEDIYFSASALIASSRPGQIFIDMTTTSPSQEKRIYDALKKKGASFLDCPVSGGDKGAREGILTAMAGGDEEVLAEAESYLSCFCQRINYCGKAGMGQTMKGANQILISGIMTAMEDAFNFARKSGLDLSLMLSALSAGAAGSWSLSNYGPRIINGDFEPGFMIKHFVKDLKIAEEEAEKLSLKLDTVALARKKYEALMQKGYADKGTQTICKEV
ncbi:MAG TPA: NAD(P)-dependent oxidoreductase [Candidatus Ornithospirochaeta avicola]|uniref:NAD(P)-dependent oxidoreductase n=1 Tax=Candidatus Ornithospirochaeta avicola TaxID=2840896 RepID=A0A9D1PRZ0_9SPIO|nr:NAD(P)-dependent oxidoreductase [Candidatus Ornithospirochaeta avicola]